MYVLCECRMKLGAAYLKWWRYSYLFFIFPVCKSIDSGTTCSSTKYAVANPLSVNTSINMSAANGWSLKIELWVFNSAWPARLHRLRRGRASELMTSMTCSSWFVSLHNQIVTRCASRAHLKHVPKLSSLENLQISYEGRLIYSSSWGPEDYKENGAQMVFSSRFNGKQRSRSSALSNNTLPPAR